MDSVQNESDLKKEISLYTRSKYVRHYLTLKAYLKYLHLLF